MRRVGFVISATLLIGLLFGESEREILARYKKELECPSDANQQVTDQKRCMIIWELRKFKSRIAVEGLLEVFKSDPSQDVRQYALFALAEMETEEAFSALAEALLYEESNPTIKRRGPSHSAPDNERYEYIPDAIYGALKKLGKDNIRKYVAEIFARPAARKYFPVLLRIVSDMAIDGLDNSLLALIKDKKNRKLLTDILTAVVRVGKTTRPVTVVRIGEDADLITTAVGVGATAKKNADARVLAALLIRRLPVKDDLFMYARSLIKDRDWRVRAAVIESLSSLQEKEAVDILIDALGKEGEERLKADIAFALHRLTSRWFADDAGGWAEWWRVARERFVFPKLKEGGPTVGAPKKSYRTEPAKYYEMEVVSGRIAFVIDVSGSMEEETGVEIEGKRYRGMKLMVAAGELRRCLKRLPPKVRFNIITFHTDCSAWQRRLVRASSSVKKSALEFVSRLSPREDTNIFDALKLAMSDPDVDTIYLLSDGLPNCGRVPTPEGVLREVRRINLTRRVVINTIAFGEKEGIEFMKKLAEENGGKFVDMTGD